MIVTRATSRTPHNETFFELAELVRVVAPLDSEPDTLAQEIVSRAISGIDGVNIPRFPKSQALDTGFVLLAAHLCKPTVDLTRLLTHFFAYDERCEDADALEHSDVIREILVDLIRNEFVPYTPTRPMALNTRTYSRQ
jgi:hypothetical protein